MQWLKKITDVQKHLVREKLDGWLIYDFQKSNPLAWEFLQIPTNTHITRRVFYWIPAKGDPVKLVNSIELHVLAHLPGETVGYTGRESLEKALKDLLSAKKKIAMEYSPYQEIPYLSKVDAGLVEWIRTFSVEVVSSGSLLQYYTALLDADQLQMHLEAAAFLDQLAAKTWTKIRQDLGKGINEHEVRTFMAEQMAQGGFITEGLPICAVNAHSSNPHFEPDPHQSTRLKEGDFVLIDLWCKKQRERAVYADISRVGVIGGKPTARHLEIFTIVREAQKRATDYVIKRHSEGKPLLGSDVDKVCRGVVEEAGYGFFFTHRTGHNIYTQDHGPGAHLDSLETLDTRPLIAGMCFSIEPGIYLPQEFGVRLEYDMYLAEEGASLITGGIQEEIAFV